MSIPFLVRKFQQAVVILLFTRIALDISQNSLSLTYFTYEVLSEGLLLLSFVLISISLLTSLRHPIISIVHLVMFIGILIQQELSFSTLDILLIIAALHLATYSYWSKNHLSQFSYYKMLLLITFTCLVPTQSWQDIIAFEPQGVVPWFLYVLMISVLTFKSQHKKLIVLVGTALVFHQLIHSPLTNVPILLLSWLVLISFLTVKIDVYHVPLRYRKYFSLWIYVTIWVLFVLLTWDLELTLDTYAPWLNKLALK